MKKSKLKNWRKRPQSQVRRENFVLDVFVYSPEEELSVNEIIRRCYGTKRPTATQRLTVWHTLKALVNKHILEKRKFKNKVLYRIRGT